MTRSSSKRYIVIAEFICLVLAAWVFRTLSCLCALEFEVIVFRLAVIFMLEVSQEISSFDIPGGEFFCAQADTRIRMFQEPVEDLSFLSADDAFPSDKTLEVSQGLPVLQLGSSEPGTILAEMAPMAESREFLVRAHPAAAPAIMPMSLTLLCHGLFSIYRGCALSPAAFPGWSRR
jgi:hypothetical protein